MSGKDSPMSSEVSKQPNAPETIWIRPASMEYSTVALNYDDDDIEYRRVKTCKWVRNLPRNRGFNTSCEKYHPDFLVHDEMFCPFCGGRLEIDNG